MTTLFYLLGYLAVIGFVALAYMKIKSYYKASPLHVRWELYPVPHEGAKAQYGGSFMEEKEWWTKPRHIEHMDDIMGIFKEVLFLHATFEHNLKLWVRTYPFHLGMYLLMGGVIILLGGTVLEIFGLSPDSWLMTVIGNVLNACALAGNFCIIVGGCALIQRRLADPGLRRYSTKEHYLNLGSFVVFGVFGLLAWLANPSFYNLAHDFMHNLLTFNFACLNSTLFCLHLLVGFLLMILIPVTNMGHLIMKYWMYHDIRWGDSPTAQDEKNQGKIPDILQYKTTWAAAHIAGDGQAKTWLEVATTNPAAPKKED